MVRVDNLTRTDLRGVRTLDQRRETERKCSAVNKRREGGGHNSVLQWAYPRKNGGAAERSSNLTILPQAPSLLGWGPGNQKGRNHGGWKEDESQ